MNDLPETVNPVSTDASPAEDDDRGASLPSDAQSPALTTARQSELYVRFDRITTERADSLVEFRDTFEARDAEMKAQQKQIIEQLTKEYHQERVRIENEYADALGGVEKIAKAEAKRINVEHEKAFQATDKQLESAVSKASQVLAREKKQTLEVFDAIKYQPRNEFQEIEQGIEQRRGELDEIEKKAVALVRGRRTKPPAPVEEQTEKWVVDLPEPEDTFQQCLTKSKDDLTQLSNQWAGRFIESGWPFLIGILTFVATIYPAGTHFGWANWLWPVVALGAGIVPGAAAFWLIYPRARREALERCAAIQKSLTTGRKCLSTMLERAREDADERTRDICNARDERLGKAKQQFSEKTHEIEEDANAERARIKESLPEKLSSSEKKHQDSLQELANKYPPILDRLEHEFNAELKQLNDDHQRELADNKKQYGDRCRDLNQRWTDEYESFSAHVAGMNDYCDTLCTPWADFDAESWTPATEPPHALRFGSFQPLFRDLHRVGCEDEFHLPAALTYPQSPSLLFKAEGAGRDAAVAAMQNVMLRLLVSLPAGKVRFTIVDPTALGENFSAFMHLADYDERLVTNRIWTEAGHISQRLTDITEHMENVIQKYLRNEYQSIQEYNQFAGEVAEPFHILVVANFPANFTDEAARRLKSIATSGARCGVYTLISTDLKLKIPRDFDLNDLEQQATTLEWDGDVFRWPDEQLRPFAVELDAPPEDAKFTQTVKTAGKNAKESSRVEVPFKTVAPKGELWTMDSRAELEVPLGRVGATQLQSLRLGRGTSQHVLMAGKTGSGKSTLLHAMITNLALHYSPAEVQFYLIDFKKGVEFKPYATCGLPHARVIAIESEREFGMSVLERLDQELKQRGDLFRNDGVQSVEGYRELHPDVDLPRVLLIIDEFQELFVKDDKIAQDAGLLLDRLVRQGRAFGIHVLLGSQTLAGAYTLARSTIGQMAVRIALQCSEADAHLILSEENTAARLLSRPGEAIYNDANGMFEGNHPFQVVWLPAEEHHEHLHAVATLAAERMPDLTPPVVFEGNVPADPAQNFVLGQSLRVLPGPQATVAPRAWLGAAVSIKEPTFATFRRQAGSNLLMVGQQDELAMGIMANAIVSLAAQLQPATAEQQPQFLVLDGARPDEPDAGFWNLVSEHLNIGLTVARGRKVDAEIENLATELERRLDEGDEASTPVYIVVHNLSRFRSLRQSEDDFGFSGFGEDDSESSPVDKLFRKLLREGPVFGIHTLIWCDTYNNVNRWFDRQTMRDMEMRVLFQMGASDSSNLMDSPAASRLGANRAYFYSEELGEYEKFRPYGRPSPDWLTTVDDALQQRAVVDSASNSGN